VTRPRPAPSAGAERWCSPRSEGLAVDQLCALPLGQSKGAGGQCDQAEELKRMHRLGDSRARATAALAMPSHSMEVVAYGRASRSY
jgi:hypothetical protein